MHRFRVHPKADHETTLIEGVVWSDGSCDVRSMMPGSHSISFESVRAYQSVLDATYDIEFIDVPDTDWAEPAVEP